MAIDRKVMETETCYKETYYRELETYIRELVF